MRRRFALLCSGLLRSAALRFASSEGKGGEKGGRGESIACAMDAVCRCMWMESGKRPWRMGDGWLEGDCDGWVGWVTGETGDREGVLSR